MIIICVFTLSGLNTLAALADKDALIAELRARLGETNPQNETLTERNV